MGKRGSWFSALKKVFSSAGSNKEKLPNNGSVKKNSKEKKKVVKHGGESRSSFIPLFREPSSIEKILGEADNQNLFTTTTRPPPSELPKPLPTPVAVGTTTSLPQVSSSPPRPPRAADSPLRAPTSSRVPSSRAPPTITSSFRPPSPQRNHRQVINYPFRTQPPTLTNLHTSATRIQATYRGYLARRSFRALKGLVRLQGVVKSQSVQRQTMNAMKQMQLLVRVQTQIHSQRLQMLENQALRHQSYRNDKEAEGTLSKWTLNQLSETGKNEDWDDSLLTKEEVEESLKKKLEATIKRERALAYAYAHQSRKGDARPAQNPLDLRSNGFPRWWNWMEPAAYPSEHQTANKNVQSTPSRSIPSRQKASPRFHAAMHQNYALDSYESGTPSSSKSTIPVRGKQIYTPSRTPTNSSVLMKYKRPSTARAANSVSDVPMNDTDSLTSCPPLSSAPNYMAPTVSAKAKLRAYSNPKERIPATPGNDSKRRFSFPLAPNFGSFKWSKGSSHDDSASQKVLPKHESARSVEEFSMDSAVSMPAIGGKKPFNRFV